ncbi:hypothetical protein SH139x_004717 [Planctomycetaceae bacterium SH139]
MSLLTTPPALRRFAKLDWRLSSLLLGLLAAYALAILCPAPGASLRETLFWQGKWGLNVSFSHLLLALLMFCGGLAATSHCRYPLRKRSRRLMLATFVSWWMPLVSMMSLVLVMRFLLAPALPVAYPQIVTGLLVLAAMPAANSSIGWTHLIGGNLNLALGLVILNTLTVPLCAPLVFQLGGVTVAGSFIVGTMWLASWIVVPAASGFFVARVRSSRQRNRRGSVPGRGVTKWCALMVIVLLNYINASAVLPQFVEGESGASGPVVLLAVALIAAFCLLNQWQARLLFQWLPIAIADQAAIRLGITMKNTGAGLVFAGASLSNQPLALLPILILTIMQHLAAGLTAANYTRVSARQLRWSRSYPDTPASNALQAKLASFRSFDVTQPHVDSPLPEIDPLVSDSLAADPMVSESRAR